METGPGANLRVSDPQTNQIKFVLSAVNDIVIQVNLRDCVRSFGDPACRSR